jgi:ATP-dependent helicase/nuclease subunit A
MKVNPELLAADARARQTLLNDFDTTLFVDAGAGTGKTTAIVERIAELVANGRINMAQLVAITFTEAAAAELRTRVRDALQQVALDPIRNSGERERCTRASAEIGGAAIDTIHAFAGDLLRTYPLHAGLPPDFTTMDEIEADLDFEERFRNWFEDVAEDQVHRDTVRKVLLLGLGPDRMLTLARALHENYDLLSETSTWECPVAPDPIGVARAAAGSIRAAQVLLKYAPAGHESVPSVEAMSFACDRLAEAKGASEALLALEDIEDIKTPKGTQAGWPNVEGVNAFKSLKKHLKTAEDEACEALKAQRAVLFCGLLVALRDFVLAYARDRQRLGVATFQDLLAWSRDLLRDNSEVRARVQTRWLRVFIDEFQDTDPLQAEIAFYLCADPHAPMPDDWRKIKLQPAKLCLVGDPKQSIYRFRRADIALYQTIRKLVAEPLVLSRNFRSVPTVIDFVNRHFQGAMTYAQGVQPEYQSLAPDAAAGGPALWRFGSPVDGKQPEVWEREADAVAGVICRIVDDGWLVTFREPQGRTSRPVQYEDICVLTPSRTNLRRLERAFEVRNIPYRIESGEIVVGTQEVKDLLSALRAIDDPSDQVAVVAALRSPIYGCSDTELVRWGAEGGRLTYEWLGQGKVERVRASLEHLASFHAKRNQTSVAALIDQFIGDRMLVAAAFGERQPRESWRRYRYVAARARAFASTGRKTLREFVEWMEGLGRSQARDVSGSIVETDESAVRVLTVHRAKGLEFPIVIMTGLGSSRSFPSPSVIGDRVEDRVEARVNDSRQHSWATPGYDDACQVEKALEDAEEIRLAYVASTRARDHLVLGLHHKLGAKPGIPAVAFSDTLVAMGGDVHKVEPMEPEEVRTVPAQLTVATAQKVLADEEAWVEARHAVLAKAIGITFTSATARAAVVEIEEPRVESDGARFRHGRGGTSVGRAVHAVLQAVDLATMDGIDTLAQAQSAAEGIAQRAGEVARLARRACESEPVRRAVASGRMWREVPIGAPSGDVILEGFIDLLFETPQGYEIVDYKTDDIRSSEIESRKDHYRGQGDAYTELVRTITGKTPVAVTFVFVSSNQAVRVESSSRPT